MSGAKMISVDAAAWRAAQSSARKLAQVRRDMPRLVAQVRQGMQDELRRARGEAAARQDATDRRLAGLSEQAARLEEETGRRLREQAERLHESGERHRRDLAAQEARLGAEIAREREERRAGLAALGARVDGMRAEHDGAAAAARRLAADARIMHDTIRDELPHERFAPGRLARLDARLRTAEANLEAHGAAYTLSQAQDLYLDLSELRVEVESLALDWADARAEALAALRTAEAAIAGNAERPVEDADPGTVMDVDHWTDGGLTALREEVAGRIAEVAGPGCPLTAAELRAVAAEEAPGHEARLAALLGRAADRMVASQIRVNVAEQVVAVLEAQGFGWTGNAYAGGDERREFFSKLRHLADDGEVVVEVAPDGDAGLTLRILSYEDDPDDSARRERSRAVSRALRAEGLIVGEPAEEAAPPDPRLRDLDALSHLDTLSHLDAPSHPETAARAEGADGR